MELLRRLSHINRDYNPLIQGRREMTAADVEFREDNSRFEFMALVPLLCTVLLIAAYVIQRWKDRMRASLKSKLYNPAEVDAHDLRRKLLLVQFLLSDWPPISLIEVLKDRLSNLNPWTWFQDSGKVDDSAEQNLLMEMYWEELEIGLQAALESLRRTRGGHNKKLVSMPVVDQYTQVIPEDLLVQRGNIEEQSDRMPSPCRRNCFYGDQCPNHFPIPHAPKDQRNNQLLKSNLITEEESRTDSTEFRPFLDFLSNQNETPEQSNAQKWSSEDEIAASPCETESGSLNHHKLTGIPFYHRETQLIEKKDEGFEDNISNDTIAKSRSVLTTSERHHCKIQFSDDWIPLNVGKEIENELPIHDPKPGISRNRQYPDNFTQQYHLPDIEKKVQKNSVDANTSNLGKQSSNRFEMYEALNDFETNQQVQGLDNFSTIKHSTRSSENLGNYSAEDNMFEIPPIVACKPPHYRSLPNSPRFHRIPNQVLNSENVISEGKNYEEKSLRSSNFPKHKVVPHPGSTDRENASIMSSVANTQEAAASQCPTCQVLADIFGCYQMPTNNPLNTLKEPSNASIIYRTETAVSMHQQIPRQAVHQQWSPQGDIPSDFQFLDNFARDHSMSKLTSKKQNIFLPNSNISTELKEIEHAHSKRQQLQDFTTCPTVNKQRGSLNKNNSDVDKNTPICHSVPVSQKQIEVLGEEISDLSAEGDVLNTRNEFIYDSPVDSGLVDSTKQEEASSIKHGGELSTGDSVVSSRTHTLTPSNSDLKNYNIGSVLNIQIEFDRILKLAEYLQ